MSSMSILSIFYLSYFKGSNVYGRNGIHRLEAIHLWTFQDEAFMAVLILFVLNISNFKINTESLVRHNIGSCLASDPKATFCFWELLTGFTHHYWNRLDFHKFLNLLQKCFFKLFCPQIGYSAIMNSLRPYLPFTDRWSVERGLISTKGKDAGILGAPVLRMWVTRSTRSS